MKICKVIAIFGIQFFGIYNAFASNMEELLGRIENEKKAVDVSSATDFISPMNEEGRNRLFCANVNLFIQLKAVLIAIDKTDQWSFNLFKRIGMAAKIRGLFSGTENLLPIENCTWLKTAKVVAANVSCHCRDNILFNLLKEIQNDKIIIENTVNLLEKQIDEADQMKESKTSNVQTAEEIFQKVRSLQ